MFKWNSCISVCVHCLLSCYHQVFIYTHWWNPIIPLFSWLNSSGFHSFSLCARCSKPLTIFIVTHFSMFMSLLYWRAKHCKRYSRSLPKRVRITSLGMLAVLFLMQPRRLLTIFVARAHHCWFIESYNHRMVWVVRELLRSCSPTPLPWTGPSFTRSGCSKPHPLSKGKTHVRCDDVLGESPLPCRTGSVK